MDGYDSYEPEDIYVSDIDIDNILQVYDGEREGCRCGCNGEYYSPSSAKDHEEYRGTKINDGRVKELIEELTVSGRKHGFEYTESADVFWLNAERNPNYEKFVEPVTIYFKEPVEEFRKNPVGGESDD